KAIEHGLTDPRLSTLRRLARTFKAPNVEFLFEGHWTGVVISTPSVADQRESDRALAATRSRQVAREEERGRGRA
ncbi:MAG: hypothetical protein V3R17_01700, partial [Hyphomicrobium sp.]